MYRLRPRLAARGHDVDVLHDRRPRRATSARRRRSRCSTACACGAFRTSATRSRGGRRSTCRAGSCGARRRGRALRRRARDRHADAPDRAAYLATRAEGAARSLRAWLTAGLDGLRGQGQGRLRRALVRPDARGRRCSSPRPRTRRRSTSEFGGRATRSVQLPLPLPPLDGGDTPPPGCVPAVARRLAWRRRCCSSSDAINQAERPRRPDRGCRAAARLRDDARGRRARRRPARRAPEPFAPRFSSTGAPLRRAALRDGAVRGLWGRRRLLPDAAALGGDLASPRSRRPPAARRSSSPSRRRFRDRGRAAGASWCRSSTTAILDAVSAALEGGAEMGDARTGARSGAARTRRRRRAAGAAPARGVSRR